MNLHFALGCYSALALLSFRRLTMTMTMVPSCIDLWFSICHANHNAFGHADHTSIKKSNKIFDEHSE